MTRLSYMKITVALCMLFFAAAHAQTVIQVSAGDSTLRLAVEAATDGDVLELVTSGGIYEESAKDKVTIDKTLTIRAAAGLMDPPIVRNTYGGTSSARLFEIQDGCDLLTLQGLVLDGRMVDGGAAHAKNAVRGRDINTPADSIRFSLKIEDCEMRHYTEAIVKLHANNAADSVIVRNCIFDETRNEGLLLRESTSAGGPLVDNVEVSNTTFTRIGREAIYIEFSDPVVLINHCTFDSISWRENKRMVYPRDVTNVTIKNSIFTNQGGTQSTAIALYGNSTISYSDTFGIAGFSLNGSSSVGAGMLGVDPLYTDPINDDYTLAANSPVLGMADDGKAMGDLRWDPNINNPVVHLVAAGDSTLRLAVAAAADGDILELVTSGGIYEDTDTDKIVVDKSLTIRARAGLAQMPVVRNTYGGTSSARLFEVRDGCDLLTLQGLFLDGRMVDGGAAHAKNAVRGQDINVAADSIRFSLKIEDCEMRYYTEAIVKLHANNAADSIIVRNSIFDETRNEGLLLRESTSAGGPLVDNVEVSNTTFTRIGREAIYIEFSDPVVLIDHCTFDSISWRENKRMVYPRDVTDVTIKNSIFTNQGGTQSTAIALYGNSTISYSDTFGIGNFSLNGSSSVGAGMLGVDPQYNDPFNDDYRLATNSPVRLAGDDGRAMGDLRWEVFPNQYYLNMVTVGNGLVDLNPAGGVYDSATVVTLTAIPDPGWEFQEWVGNIFPPNVNPNTITMRRDETVTAIFNSLSPQVTLTVDTVGLGFVTLNPMPVNGTYDQGTVVTMTATPRTNWAFSQWSGDISTTTNPVMVTMDSSIAVVAEFSSLITQYVLNIDTVGQGGVSASPEPVVGSYDSSTVVTLTADPDPGWEFIGWTGDLSGSNNPDSLVMDANKMVTASFQEIVFPNRTLDVDTTMDLRDAVQIANNNSSLDTLRLVTSGGLYTSTSSSDVAVLSPLAVVAAPGLAEKPIITNSDVQMDNDDIFRVFDDFLLRGVILDGGHPRTHGPKYGVRLRHYAGSDSVRTGTNLTFVDVDFRDIFEGKLPNADGHALRINEWIRAGTVKFEGCTFANIGYEAIRISDTEVWPTTGAVDSLIVRNTTFTNIDAECIRYYSDVDTSTADAPVIVEHVTINNSATRIMFLKNSGGAVVRDVIISNSRTSGHGRDGDLLDAQGSGSTVSYIDTFNVKAVELKSTKGGDVDETTVYGIDPEYAAPDSLDYTLLATSHLYRLASDGEALGDLNWATNISVNVMLTVSVIDSGQVMVSPAPIGNTYDPNTTVTLTAVADSGWMFMAWQGDLTGSNNPETLLLDADKSVTAVFEPMTGIGDDDLLPKVFSVSPNYPNPFNPTTRIDFQVPRLSPVKLVIYNVLGQKVRMLIDAEIQPGYHNITWDGRNDGGTRVATGLYIYRFEASDFTRVRKMILMK